jgi:hypothetical protein
MDCGYRGQSSLLKSHWPSSSLSILLLTKVQDKGVKEGVAVKPSNERGDQVVFGEVIQDVTCSLGRWLANFIAMMIH